MLTLYPKKYAHGFCFAVLCCGYTLTDFPISIRLTSLALWQSNDCPSASKATLMNMDKYFMWIHYERLHNHNKAKHNRTVCIFLGIYCKPWPASVCYASLLGSRQHLGRKKWRLPDPPWYAGAPRMITTNQNLKWYIELKTKRRLKCTKVPHPNTAAPSEFISCIPKWMWLLYRDIVTLFIRKKWHALKNVIACENPGKMASNAWHKCLWELQSN